MHRTCRRRALSILIRVAERDVPAVGVLVEDGGDVDAVDLRDELHRGLDLEVAGALEDAAEARVHREGADLVRVRLTRLAIDPAQQRRDARLVLGIGEEVDQQRDPAARLVEVPVDGVADVAVVAAQRGDRVADVRRADELPVQVRRVAPDGEVELRRQRLPELA